jgi:hypothetical protein
LSPAAGRAIAVAAAVWALVGCATVRERGAARVDPGRAVIVAGYRMVFEEKRVVRGSCWDFVNAVYETAGFPASSRRTVFQGKQGGPYADPDLLQPGDWVMHRNLEYGEVEHSSIFVQWTDKARRLAQTLDYAGMNRSVTGRISQHRYTKIFAILRPWQADGRRGDP